LHTIAAVSAALNVPEAGKVAQRHEMIKPSKGPCGTFPVMRRFNYIPERNPKLMTNAKKNPDEAASAEERRALDADELSMADQARNPALGALSDRDLSDLITRLRSRRNRARDISNRQGREARAKASPSGAAPARGNEGTLQKHDYLSSALSRALAEREKRGGSGIDEAAEDDQPTQKDLAVKAMEMKQAGETGPSPMTEDGGPLHPDDPDASDGKGNLGDTARRMAPSGAFDHAGNLPSRERSRTRY